MENLTVHFPGVFIFLLVAFLWGSRYPAIPGGEGDARKLAVACLVGIPPYLPHLSGQGPSLPLQSAHTS